uniref:Translation initiation factor IF-2, chloroplastic n=1 Tax=Crouania attenuata TaxID=42002 RepID=A0A4D6WNY2_9FLOR|nr:Translation initiation factor 2 [Crouania attenuata]
MNLNSPKLIISQSTRYSVKLDNVIDLNDVAIKIPRDNDLSNKSSKKNKIHLQSDIVTDAKKTKLKLAKKSRRPVDLDNENKFSAKKQGIINDDNISLDVIKKPKLKKKSKNKFNGSTQNLSVDKLTSDNLIQQDKKILIIQPLTIEELAFQLNIPATEIIMYLFLQGISVTINQVIDVSIAIDIAKHYNFELLDPVEDQIRNNVYIKPNLDAKSLIETGQFTRPPIIAILGHVDHGKTTLLDAILNTTLVDKEYGGITQSINGYTIDHLWNNTMYRLMIVDTPGHDAFIGMRSRGIEITDIALLIVAADDGLKTQTIECIRNILSHNLPYIVVINKVDKPKIDLQKIKEQLAEYGMVDKKWGGEALIVEVSALHNKNIDLLISSICKQSHSLHLGAQPEQLAQGTVLESSIDRKKGVIANLVVKNGTLNIGDYCIVDNMYCKVKNLLDCFGSSIKSASPSAIVQMLGFSSTPIAGSKFHCASTEKDAKLYIAQNKNSFNTFSNIPRNPLSLLNNRVTFTNYGQKIEGKTINLLLKADTQGAIEAVINAFNQISQKKVQINVLVANSGIITNSDLDLAQASNAIIIGFNIEISSHIDLLIKKYNILVKNFYIIYNLLDFVKGQMLDLIDPEYDKVFLGRAIVQTVFHINKGLVAGCVVEKGKLQKESHIHILRSDEIIYKCLLTSLKRIKDDVNEVPSGNECGVMCTEYNLWKQNDIIEAYTLIEKSKTL